ncbi:LLM class flavin-dependent oxidoreductase [Actinopolymorpha pittospori]|uniref:Luciferase-like domain-containing protein n=1 Tax=Actinopolymorpha pittospori TaxID=648752 RepID=A0A927MX55_9ACTN|nr:hypothetical protein [Actinopolymorpha pittospori]
MSTKHLHLNAFLMSTGHHEASWRLPESNPIANTDVEHYRELARIAERGTFDSIFFADSPALFNEVGRRPSGALELTVLLTAIAPATERIGLIATASTTYNDPYNLARRFASVDHVSGGRAGWNVVITATLEAARNFGMEELPSHRDRYQARRSSSRCRTSCGTAGRTTPPSPTRSAACRATGSASTGSTTSGGTSGCRARSTCPARRRRTRCSCRPGRRRMARNWPRSTPKRCSPHSRPLPSGEQT